MEPIQIGKDGLCTCHCGTKCPLGRIGSSMRCTRLELTSAGFLVEEKKEKKEKKLKKLKKFLKLFREYLGNSSEEIDHNIAFLAGYNQQRFTTDDVCHVEDKKSWNAGFEYGKSITRLEEECDKHFPRSVD